MNGSSLEALIRRQPTRAALVGLRGLPLLSAALLLLDDWHSLRHELDATVPAVWSCVQLAVIVQVILAVELILLAELALESVGSLAVGTSAC